MLQVTVSKGACNRNISPLNPLTEWAFADAETEGACMIILNPRKRLLSFHRPPRHEIGPSHAGLFSCVTGTNPTQNNRGKQGRSIYTRAKRLLGTGPKPQKKDRLRRPSSPPGAAGILRTLSSMRGIFPAGKSSVYQRPQGCVAAPLWSVWQAA